MCDIDPIDEAVWDTAHTYQDPETGQKGAAALAKALNTNVGVFKLKVSRSVDTHRMNLKEARGSMLITRNYSILETLAREVGHAVYKLPTKKYLGDVDILNAWADWNEEISQTVHQIRQTVKDNAITKSEISEIRRELIEDFGKGMQLIAVLERMAEPE